MSANKKAWLTVFSIILFFAALYVGKRRMLYQLEMKKHPFESLADQLEKKDKLGVCESSISKQRKYAAQVLDRFAIPIREMRAQQKPVAIDEKKFKPFGSIYIRPEPTKKVDHEFDRSVWSWYDVFALIQKTQVKVNDTKLWLDLDHGARFLLSLDVKRVIYDRPFLPPDKAARTFRPNLAVSRESPRLFKVLLNPGDFSAQKEQLKKMIESAWHNKKFQVKVQWSNSPNAYRFLAKPFETQSYTNHLNKTISMKKFVPYKTFAHEVGHVLGFDDHYYEVWHAQNCYYTQEYRTSDLMSDSENGSVQLRHWELLDKAYPWKKEALREKFSYTWLEAAPSGVR